VAYVDISKGVKDDICKGRRQQRRARNESLATQKAFSAVAIVRTCISGFQDELFLPLGNEQAAGLDEKSLQTGEEEKIKVKGHPLAHQEENKRQR
jgi:hypothetical protein